MLNSVKLIAIDGDDTLWYNEAVYNKAFDIVMQILHPNITNDCKIHIFTEFNSVLAKNVKLMGFGYKTYIITLISYLIENCNVPQSTINSIIKILSLEFQKPVTLYPLVEQTINQLHVKYNLIIISKGETFEQMQKIRSSNIYSRFLDAFIVEEKNEDTYIKILEHYNVLPGDFLMIGNSFHSDIQPVVNIGGSAIYIDNTINTYLENLPLETELSHPNITAVKCFNDIIKYL